MQAQVHVWSALLPIQLVARARISTWLKALELCTHTGGLKVALGFWLWIGSIPAVSDTWGVNQIDFSVSPSVHKYAFPVTINLKKQKNLN